MEHGRADDPPIGALAHPDVVVPTKTDFLDLDDDGIPDAVHTTTIVGFDLSGDGAVDLVEVTEEMASGIGIDGDPSAITLTDTFEYDFDHDGVIEEQDSITVVVTGEGGTDKGGSV